MASLKKLGYFTGKKFWEKFEAGRLAYPGDDAQLNVYIDERDKLWVAVCDAGDAGDPINESHHCPGSPGC